MAERRRWGRKYRGIRRRRPLVRRKISSLGGRTTGGSGASAPRCGGARDPVGILRALRGQSAAANGRAGSSIAGGPQNPQSSLSGHSLPAATRRGSWREGGKAREKSPREGEGEGGALPSPPLPSGPRGSLGDHQCGGGRRRGESLVSHLPCTLSPPPCRAQRATHWQEPVAASAPINTTAGHFPYSLVEAGLVQKPPLPLSPPPPPSSLSSIRRS